MIIKQKYFLYFLLIAYAALSLTSVFTNIPYHDTLYYWDWGRHLALSYYDGPPAVAYIIRGFVSLFGSSAFSLNMLGILGNLCIAFFIYKLAESLFGKEVAKFSALIWLLNATNFIQYSLKFEYDTPTSLFWIASIYFFHLAYKHKQSLYLYAAGFSGGLMMLSKYTGVLLFVSIFIMMITSRNYRYLLKNKHTYISALLAILVFSPVLIWNYQHHFVSLLYQSSHGFNHELSLNRLLTYIGQTFVGYNLFLLMFIYVVIKNFRTLFQDDRLQLLIYPAIITLLFFLIASPFSFKTNWNETYFLTATILIAYYCTASKGLNQILSVTLILNFIAICVITASLFLQNSPLQNKINLIANDNKNTILTINQIYDGKEPVFTDQYATGALLAYFLRGQPRIYATPPNAHQYAYWSHDIIQRIQQGKISHILYITHNPYLISLKPLFQHCNKVYKATNKNYHSYYVYRCV